MVKICLSNLLTVPETNAGFVDALSNVKFHFRTETHGHCYSLLQIEIGGLIVTSLKIALFAFTVLSVATIFIECSGKAI